MERLEGKIALLILAIPIFRLRARACRYLALQVLVPWGYHRTGWLVHVQGWSLRLRVWSLRLIGYYASESTANTVPSAPLQEQGR